MYNKPITRSIDPPITVDILPYFLFNILPRFNPKNVNIKTLNHNGNIIIIVCKIQYLFLINAYAHPSAGTVFQFLLYQVHTYTVR